VSNSATITVFVAAPPVVTNSPAENIQPQSAKVGRPGAGTVGCSGRHDVLWFGKRKHNAGAWSNSVVLGLQNGAFTQTVAGLVPNTTYFCT